MAVGISGGYKSRFCRLIHILTFSRSCRPRCWKLLSTCVWHLTNQCSGVL
jgi:hypothetical protein